VVAVGDSIKDDVGSALKAKITSILVTDHQIDWGYEDQENTPHHQIPSLVELPPLLDSIYG